MPLRDNHGAALARADALQRQLDDERARGADGAEQVKRLETELAEARSRLRRAQAELADLRPTVPRKPAAPSNAKPKPAWMTDEVPEPTSVLAHILGMLFFFCVLMVWLALRYCR